MTGVSQAGNQRTWQRRSWQCEEKHAWHFTGSKWVYGSASWMCVDSRFCKTKQSKTKPAKNQTLEQTLIRWGTELGWVTRRSPGRAPVDNRCPASHRAMQNDSWLFQILKRSLPLSYSSFSTSTEFEVCSLSSWMFEGSCYHPYRLMFSEHQLSVFSCHAKIGALAEMCVNVHFIGVARPWKGQDGRNQSILLSLRLSIAAYVQTEKKIFSVEAAPVPCSFSCLASTQKASPLWLVPSRGWNVGFEREINCQNDPRIVYVENTY